jgi:hypothetical protein
MLPARVAGDFEIAPARLAGRDRPAAVGLQSLDLGREPVGRVASGEQALIPQDEPVDARAFGQRSRTLPPELRVIVPVEPGDHCGEAERARQAGHVLERAVHRPGDDSAPAFLVKLRESDA